ncbi:hypothetical protein AMTR_s00151p00059160 [Amborella trichopoda]|uniref:Uncharacterized protein n=1 Tax=Amborella trichopoda TaxID=13333 RepID=W1NJU5_AMBTC|nr:hypothetical protein AMTR_s00151p00059160 [Amborella trichopoda]
MHCRTRLASTLPSACTPMTSFLPSHLPRVRRAPPPCASSTLPCTTTVRLFRLAVVSLLTLTSQSLFSIPHPLSLIARTLLNQTQAAIVTAPSSSCPFFPSFTSFPIHHLTLFLPHLHLSLNRYCHPLCYLHLSLHHSESCALQIHLHTLLPATSPLSPSPHL